MSSSTVLRTLAVLEQRVGFRLQDVAEDLAMVECRPADHGGRRNHDLVDAELAQLLDRRAPDDATHSRPDHRAHAHRAGLAGRIDRTLTTFWVKLLERPDICCKRSHVISLIAIDTL